ncbi:MAG: histidine phosphatase family protein [Candidatus Marinimicrobia bacterium]|jgi:phosphohistidine phosphatase SixA|nr:histidine phosphatase family protein [Candidatus Neomarinimicrobiota bacterium]MBT3763605.1 histidine phosphatase family protein [Candidatus Neomarinimicrobiota bacterium]MBT4270440.1 histidine phosphatase family protein [Candidatus Neomarinimicrobiota bacterium]MBT4372598.1 histidine phosphatase family protein [Candidatus Neomarinimicrobiota bacterium]MBT4810122.1 histidine phosphatase family protein [Candidatus Neomarinimicrobiota bacterium]
MTKTRFSIIIILMGLLGCMPSVSSYSVDDFQCYPEAVYLIRHAEKQIIKGEKNPELTKSGFNRAAALADSLVGIDNGVIYSSEFTRTQQTVNPLAKTWKTKVNIHTANDPEGQIQRALEHCGKMVVIAGHSNTLPNLIALFGIKDEVAISDDQYGDLFIIRWENNTPHLTTTHVGE